MNNFERLLEAKVEFLKKFTDKELGIEIRVVANLSGRFVVSMWDIDANEQLPLLKVFSDKQKALKWAETEFKKAIR